jgi:hypothetical protein
MSGETDDFLGSLDACINEVIFAHMLQKQLASLSESERIALSLSWQAIVSGRVKMLSV